MPIRQDGKKIGKKHNSAQSVLSIASNSNNSERRIKCIECDKLISNQRRHLRHHAAIHLDKVMFECQLCGHGVRRLRNDSVSVF